MYLICEGGGGIPETHHPPRPAIQHPVIEARKCLSFSASGTWLINYKLACALKSAQTSPHYFTNGCQLCRGEGGGYSTIQHQLRSLEGSSLSSFDHISAAFLSAFTHTHRHWERAGNIVAEGSILENVYGFFGRLFGRSP